MHSSGQRQQMKQISSDPTWIKTTLLCMGASCKKPAAAALSVQLQWQLLFFCPPAPFQQHFFRFECHLWLPTCFEIQHYERRIVWNKKNQHLYCFEFTKHIGTVDGRKLSKTKPPLNCILRRKLSLVSSSVSMLDVTSIKAYFRLYLHLSRWNLRDNYLALT